MKSLYNMVMESVPMWVVKEFMHIKRSKATEVQIDNFMQAIENTQRNTTRSRNGYRLYLPANFTLDNSGLRSRTQDEVEGILGRLFSIVDNPDFKISDYVGGTMMVPGQKNPVKFTKGIEKLEKSLANNPNLSKYQDDFNQITTSTRSVKNKKYNPALPDGPDNPEFVPQEYRGIIDMINKDELRYGSKIAKEPLTIVISNHFYDILGMSTGREHWVSCMDLIKDSKQHLISTEHIDNIEKDIQFGTLTAYLILRRDTNIEHPLARVLLKPYKLLDTKQFNRKNDDWPVIYFPEQTIYGFRTSAFRKQLINICKDAQEQLQNAWSDLWLQCTKGLYNDYSTAYRDAEDNYGGEVYDPEEGVKFGDKNYLTASNGIFHLDDKGQLI